MESFHCWKTDHLGRAVLIQVSLAFETGQSVNPECSASDLGQLTQLVPIFPSALEPRVASLLTQGLKLKSPLYV
eukprot:scaffold2984_cov80-Cylindrotheca_fusiformis.AAC.2